MRKPLSLVMLLVLLQACSVAGISASTDTPTATPTENPTLTFTPSITPSATIVRIPTQDWFQPTSTLGPIPLLIGSVTVAPYVTPTSSRPGPGFVSVTFSDNKMYWGGCKYNKAVVTTEVEDPEAVISVVIFVRVKSAAEEDYTPWTTGDVMFNHRDGTFTYTLVGSNVEGHNHYKKSWIFVQLVATDKNGEEVGRTHVFENAIALSPCMCLDPSTGCPPTPIRKPTPTPTKKK